MNKEIIIKYASDNILEEIMSVGFDSSYISNVSSKYDYKAYKILNLKSPEANIFKQLCLSLGFDCAVNRDVITCKSEYSDCYFLATKKQILDLIGKLKFQPFRLKNLALQLNDIVNYTYKPLIIRNKIFDWSKPYIMGILNITDDSFSDGGKYIDINTALDHVKKMIEEGADIIDIGAEASNYNAQHISVDVEQNKIKEIVSLIRKFDDNVVISVDTKNYLTAKSAIDYGADIINDVTGFSFDNNLFNYVCHNNIPSIAMHSYSVPAKPVNNDSEIDIVQKIYMELSGIKSRMLSNGLSEQNIILDVGIGFGKSVNDTYTILKRFNEFKSLNTPLLLGLSRKSFITKTFNNLTVDDIDIITAIYSVLVSSRGANILRVHDVRTCSKYFEYLNKIL